LNARKKAGRWPEASFWWEIHPAVAALEQLLENSFERDMVPTIAIEEKRGVLGFLIYSAAFNQRGQPALSRLEVAVKVKDGWQYLPCQEGLEKVGFKSSAINPGLTLSSSQTADLKAEAQSLYKNLTGKDSDLLKKAHIQWLRRDTYRSRLESQIQSWKTAREKYLNEAFSSPAKARRLQEELSYVARVAEDQRHYAETHFDVQYKNPYIRFVAAFVGA